MKIKLSSRVIHVVYVCCYFRSCHLYCFGSVRIVLFYLLLHSKHSFHLKYFLFALNCSKIEFYYKWIRNEKLPFSILEHFANWDSYGRWSDASKTSCHTSYFIFAQQWLTNEKVKKIACSPFVIGNIALWNIWHLTKMFEAKAIWNSHRYNKRRLKELMNNKFCMSSMCCVLELIPVKSQNRLNPVNFVWFYKIRVCRASFQFHTLRTYPYK